MDSATKAAISLLPKEAQEYTQGMYNTIEDVYGVNPMDLVNKGNLLQGLSTLLWKQMIGEKPDELAKTAADKSMSYYRLPVGWADHGGKWGYPVYAQPQLDEIIDLLREYQNQYGLLTDEGVNIVEDGIKNYLFSKQYQDARKEVKSIKADGKNPLDFMWDLEKGPKGHDITDIIYAIHGTDYNRQKENK